MPVHVYVCCMEEGGMWLCFKCLLVCVRPFIRVGYLPL